MGYPGTFTFINKDTSNHPKKKNYEQDFAILSHVSRTRRKWMRERRQERLKSLAQMKRMESSEKVPIPRRVLSQRHETTLVRLNPAESRLEPVTSQDDEADTDQNAIGTSNSRPRRNKALVAEQQQRPLQNSQPSPNVLKGNSDPFTASALPITPEIHDLLQLSSQFYVFWAWAASASSLFQAKAARDWRESVRASIQGIADMHIILAGGAYIKAHLLDQAHDRQGRQTFKARGLMHKTLALTRLRKDLDHDIRGTLETVLRLVSLEFSTNDFEAAVLHHRAARTFIRNGSDCQSRTSKNQKGATFAVAEVWTAAAALQKPIPCGIVDWEAKRRWPNDRLIPSPPMSSNLFIYDMEWPSLHSSIPLTLRELFSNIQKIPLYMSKLSQIEDEVEIFTTVSYLNAQSASLRAKILETWVDFDDSRTSSYILTDVPETIDDLTFSSSCLAALLFINIIFMYKPIATATNFTNSTTNPILNASANDNQTNITADYYATNRLNVFNISSNSNPNSSSTTTTPTPAQLKPLMSPSVNNKALTRLRNDIKQIRRNQSLQVQIANTLDVEDTCAEPDPELMLWVTFIAALAERLEKEAAPKTEESHSHAYPVRGPADANTRARSRSSLQDFQYYAQDLHVISVLSWQDAKSVLRRFLYHDALMDTYLITMMVNDS